MKNLLFDCLSEEYYKEFSQRKTEEDKKLKEWKKKKKKKVKRSGERKKKKRPKPQEKPLKSVKGKMTYKDYIRSEYWRRRRNEYYKNHKKQCFVCKGTQRIGLHHISYDRFGNEEDKDLVALCWLCHSEYHERYEKAGRGQTYQYIIQKQEELIGVELQKWV